MQRLAAYAIFLRKLRRDRSYGEPRRTATRDQKFATANPSSGGSDVSLALSQVNACIVSGL